MRGNVYGEENSLLKKTCNENLNFRLFFKFFVELVIQLCIFVTQPDTSERIRK